MFFPHLLKLFYVVIKIDGSIDRNCNIHEQVSLFFSHAVVPSKIYNAVALAKRNLNEIL